LDPGRGSAGLPNGVSTVHVIKLSFELMSVILEQPGALIAVVAPRTPAAG